MFRDIPESVKVVTEFIWKARWFLLIGWLGWLVFEVVTKMIPYLMWSFILKNIFGGIFSFLSL
jgi:hypothetical protein